MKGFTLKAGQHHFDDLGAIVISQVELESFDPVKIAASVHSTERSFYVQEGRQYKRSLKAFQQNIKEGRGVLTGESMAGFRLRDKKFSPNVIAHQK